MKPTEEDKCDGLKHKYNITHADGSPVDPKGIYFVLRLDPHEDCDQVHIIACRVAARVYAAAISKHLPALSADILRALSLDLVDVMPDAVPGLFKCQPNDWMRKAYESPTIKQNPGIKQEHQ